MNFADKTVVITGASRGIGAATARSFVAHGAKTVLLARSERELAALEQELGENSVGISCDVSDADAVDVALQSAFERFGPVDILINNAALIAPIGKLSQTDPDQWSTLVDVNIKGVYFTTRNLLPKMIENGGGTIINVSSGAAHGAVEGWSAYCSSKAAVSMFTQCVHLEEFERGIRAFSLSPGTVATQMQRDIKASGINPVSQLDWSDHIPPEWPAQAMLWMCSSDADEYRGLEVSLRNENIRARVGLV